MPADAADLWWRERNNILARVEENERGLTDHEAQRLLWLHRDKIETLLDNGRGECWLARPGIAALIQTALLHFDGSRYDMLAWCVMPNHVHAVLTPLAPYELPKIMHSWKGYTAVEANKRLGRTGGFWQPEYYDHVVRDRLDLERCIQYVINNPTKAGLHNWPWWGVRKGWDAVARPSGP